MRMKPVLSTCFLALMPMQATAQDEFGALEFVRACAVCHGIHGRGDAVASSLLSVPVPDLTQIAARNDGNFPTEDIISIIDGRGTRGHGPMPVWGYEMQNDNMAVVGSEAADAIVRARIISIAEHLKSIQE